MTYPVIRPAIRGVFVMVVATGSEVYTLEPLGAKAEIVGKT
jgi:hypothetical protein